ncbi:MAG: PAS domain-containing protein, partial [Silvibacterium sp.]|nr:PAS domain-containing protein [Silvibacterium sp.]
WLYTACGLVRITRTELDKWIADPSRRIETAVWDAADGVRLRSTPASGYGPPVAKTADGKLWFVTGEGVQVVDPHHLAFNPIPPPVYIEQVTANDISYGAKDGLQLPPLVRDLVIDYTALSFIEPEKVSFRVKLEGQDKDWREPNNKRHAHYTNLPPRHYRFRVIAANNSGVWNKEGATLDFTIPPAWYQTNWFVALCVAALLALLWGLHRLRLQQLRREERQFREAVDSMPAIAFIARTDGYRSFENKRWLEYTGLTAEQAVGAGWQAAIHPDDLKRVLERWRASLASGESLEYETRLRGVDGQYRWFLARAVPVRNQRNKIVKWCGAATDIEDRKRAEQLQADLAHVTRVTTLGELAASLAHEIKQPIAGAITSADSCLRWLEHSPPNVDRARAAATRIKADGNRAASIIDKLRLLYKKAPPKRELVAINEVIGEMVMLLRGEATKNTVSIRTDLAAGLPVVMADRVQLQQVLMNLMLNGIEAMRETGGVLTVTSQVGEQRRVIVSVSDTGEGLPPEKADNIFDAFFTTKPQGSGMGLAISKSIVESHGGRIWATANEGRGAAFHFTLPVEADSVHVAATGTQTGTAIQG